MFEVSVEQTFPAAHILRGHSGKCANLHGHNYRVRVTVQAEELDAVGLVIDFADIKQEMKKVIARLDHRFLNELEPFDVVNPSAENLARYFCQQLEKAFRPEVRISEVRVWESDSAWAGYRP